MKTLQYLIVGLLLVGGLQLSSYIRVVNDSEKPIRVYLLDYNKNFEKQHISLLDINDAGKLNKTKDEVIIGPKKVSSLYFDTGLDHPKENKRIQVVMTPESAKKSEDRPGKYKSEIYFFYDKRIENDFGTLPTVVYRNVEGFSWLVFPEFNSALEHE